MTMKQTMIKYEYSVQNISVRRLDSEHGGMDKYLYEAGEEGWQLVNLMPKYLVDDLNHTISSYVFVFMRPKVKK